MCTDQPCWVISGMEAAKQAIACTGAQAVLQECNEVFEELLGLRSMCWRLGRTWLDCCQHTGQRPGSIIIILSTMLLMLNQTVTNAHCRFACFHEAVPAAVAGESLSLKLVIEQESQECAGDLSPVLQWRVRAAWTRLQSSGCAGCAPSERPPRSC